ncbi:MAG TPA: hypothetical protein VKS01_06710 [Bryobacteraceae bacterium]|nr:hypothetical protein [Bryobacteraceae bacterium]
MRLSIALLALAALARADSLETILARMDASAKTFKSATATLTQTAYTAVVKETFPPDTGALTIKRNGANVSALIVFGEPDAHTVVVKGHTAELYHPKANEEEIYDLGKNAGLVDQFLLLAFGTSGAELQRHYNITAGGAEKIGDVATTRLDLTPMTGEVKKVITKIQLWIPDGKSNAIQEKVTEPSGNYDLAVYSNIKTNPNVPDSVFDLKLPKDVKKIYPQR